jgi:homoserine acetyltransferase
MAYAADYDSTDVEYYSISSFTFSNGTTLHDLKIAYRNINPNSQSGTVLIPTCYAGLINTTLTFSEAPLSALSNYHIVIVAMLGNGESASPSNKQFFPSPGELRYQDQIHAQYRLLTEHLKITKLEAVVGFSMGGQQAYHWAVMYPEFMKRIVVICSSARTSPHNYAFLEGPINALTSSIDYIAFRAMKEKVARGEDVGANLKEVKPKRGLRALCRAYGAWLTSTTWFRERWWGKREGGLGFASVEEWMAGREEGYLAWDAEDLLVLARMWQIGDISTVIPGQETLTELGGKEGDDQMYEKSLGSIKAWALVMPCSSDQYFPPEDGEIECKYLKLGVFDPIPSIWGHTAGGGLDPVAAKWMDEKISKFMQNDIADAFNTQVSF